MVHLPINETADFIIAMSFFNGNAKVEKNGDFCVLIRRMKKRAGHNKATDPFSLLSQSKFDTLDLPNQSRFVFFEKFHRIHCLVGKTGKCVDFLLRELKRSVASQIE